MTTEDIDPIDRYADAIIDKAQSLIDQGVSSRAAYRYAVQASELIRKARKQRSDRAFAEFEKVIRERRADT